MSRKASDQLLRHIMRAYDAPKHTIAMVYAGVRVGGWMAYRKHSQQAPA